MIINVGDFIVIKNHDLYSDKAAEVLSIENNKYLVKTFIGSNTLELNADQVKWKKKCVCGQTSRGPFCDGSHARIH